MQVTDDTATPAESDRMRESKQENVLQGQDKVAKIGMFMESTEEDRGLGGFGRILWSNRVGH